VSARAAAAVAALLACDACAGAPGAAGPAAARPLVLPASEHFVFASGATLTVVPMHELPLVSVRVFSEGGARFDPEGKDGLASFAAELLEEGPAGSTREQFLAALDRLGAEFESEGTFDDVGLSLDLMARDLPAGLDLLLAAALEPGFDEEAVARARERTLGRIVASREDEAGLAREAFLARLWPGRRYGRPLLGTPECVQSFTREDVMAFHRAAFSAANLRVVVAGDVQPVNAGLAVASAAMTHGLDLGVAVASEPPPFLAAGRDGEPWPERRIVLVHKPGVIQPQILFGCRGPDATHPDWTALRAANVPFGGGFTSWLVDRLRVDLGLTYSASSALQPQADGSTFVVRTFSKNETVGRLIEEAFALLDRLKRGELDEAALERARLTLATRTIQRLETTAGVAGLVKEQQLLRLGADWVERSFRELGALGLPDVKTAVARHLPDSQQVLCVVVGDEGAIGAALRALGQVEVVDYKTLAPLGSETRSAPGAECGRGGTGDPPAGANR
jgi:predicted Zn-dependent peptidase